MVAVEVASTAVEVVCMGAVEMRAMCYARPLLLVKLQRAGACRAYPPPR